MARQTDLLEKRVIGEINLTPLMDLTFILLITFIITFPLLEQGLQVDLPTAKGEALEESESITVSLDENGGWYIDQRKLNFEQFKAEVRYLKAQRPKATYLVRGDKTLPYGKLIELMHVLKEEGIEKLSLVTQSGVPVGGA